jgi:hypothetical protein
MNSDTTLTRQRAEMPGLEAFDAQVRPRWGWLVLRFLGALAVLAAGAVHVDQYFGPYAEIPTIGTLFLVNFAAAVVIALALLAPLEHLAGRWGGCRRRGGDPLGYRPHRGIVPDAAHQ